MNTNNKPKPSIPSYSPSLLDIETLESIFVKRQSVLDDLFERHKSSIIGSSKHFSLLIGPRGMGKTHLISMLYHQFNHDESVKNKVMISWLREEEWGIASYLDLLTQTINALSMAYQLDGIATKLDALLSLAPSDAEYQAEQILLDILNGKTLLMLVENLNIIFDAMQKEGQEKFRALIQNTGQISIIAAAQALFSGVSLRSCPFYGFFNIAHLEKLSFTDAVELLSNIAKYENKQDLVDILQTEKGRVRVRALHHLAGGSPRIYVIFSQFIQADSLDEFTAPMLKMLDELTPYYQAKMLELSPQQRKLVTFLCRARGAVTVQDIARQNHITQQTAAGQLKKLKVSGFVESQKMGKESYYEIAEPLMRLVFSVKENRGTPVAIIIELIRHWFSLDELKQFKDDDSIKLLGKQFIDGDIIQQAMEVKEPSPHLSSSMTEFKRYILLGDSDNAKKVLADLQAFSLNLTQEVHKSLAAYLFSEQEKISGRNIQKRTELTLKLIVSAPEEYKAQLKFACVGFCVVANKFKEKDLISLIHGLFDKTEGQEVPAVMLIILIAKAISPEEVGKLCNYYNLQTGFLLGCAYSSNKLAATEKEHIYDAEYTGEVIKNAEPIGFVECVTRNDYSSDYDLFENIKKYKPLKDDVCLILATRFTKDSHIQTLNALIDTTLENVKNESISESILSLKAYAESGDKKCLMGLPKEVRALILDNQSERDDD